MIATGAGLAEPRFCLDREETMDMSDAPTTSVLKAALDLLAANNANAGDLDQLLATMLEQQGHAFAGAFAALMMSSLAYVEARIAAGDKELALRFPILVEAVEL